MRGRGQRDRGTKGKRDDGKKGQRRALAAFAAGLGEGGEEERQRGLGGGEYVRSAWRLSRVRGLPGLPIWRGWRADGEGMKRGLA